MEVIESIYAYICEKSYLGKTRNGNQIYNITNGINSDEYNLVYNTMTQIFRSVRLSSLSALCDFWTQEYDDKSYELYSFSYYYSISNNNEYSLFCRSSLRESIKNKNNKGGDKNLDHSIIFKKKILEGYAIDLMKLDSLEKNNEIGLENDEVNVCEVQPEKLLDPIDINKIKTNELNNIESSNTFTGENPKQKIVAEIVNAIVLGKRNNKKTYIVYHFEDWKEVIDLIVTSIKMFPKEVANTISFVTCCSNPKEIPVDVCGIIATKQDVIESLREEAYVIKIEQLNMGNYISNCTEKTAFSLLLSQINSTDFSNWNNRSKFYLSQLKDITQIEEVVSFYNILKSDNLNYNYPFNKTVEEMNVIKEFHESSFKIDLNDEREVIQIIGNKLEYVYQFLEKDEYAEISDIYNKFLESIFSLFNKMSNDFEKSLVIKIIYFTFKDINNLESRPRFCQFVLFYGYRIIEKLKKSCYFLSDDELRDTIKELFEKVEQHKSIKINYDNLENMIANLLVFSLNINYLESAKYFAEEYLRHRQNELNKVLNLLFDDANYFEEMFKFLFNMLIKKKNEKEKYLDDWIKTIVECLSTKEMRLKVINILYEKYNFAQENEIDIIRKILSQLIFSKQALLKEKNIKCILDELENVVSIVNDYDNIAFKEEMYDLFAENMFETEEFNEIIESIKVETLNEENIVQFKKVIGVYKNIREEQKTEVENNLISRLEAVINKYNQLMLKFENEKKLIDFRVDFIVREFLLLDEKTMFNLLNEYLGKDNIKERFNGYGVKGKIYKDENFLKYSEEILREFLIDKKDEDKILDNKIALSKDIRSIRNSRNVGIIVVAIRDIVFGIVESSIYTFLMTFAVWSLGTIICNLFYHGFFKSINYLLAIITVLVSETIFWYNFKDRRRHNVLLKSIWQTTLILIVFLVLYLLTQYVFGAIK